MVESAAVDPADDAARPGARGSERLVPVLTWVLAASMAAAACLLALPGILQEPDLARPGLVWLALVPLFALAEVVVIHLPTQRNAYGHTLRELPAVLGLIFLPPQQYVTAYVLGAGLALVVAARMRGVKLAFNLGMFALEAALGALAYHAILQGGDPLSFTGWAAAILAVVLTDLMSAAAVTAAISLTEGVFDGEVLHEALVSGSFAAFVNTCVALLVATLVVVQPTALPLLGVVVVLLTVAYRVYVSLARGHAQTRLLYRFVDRTSAATSSDEVITVVLDETAALMHAERAYLVQVAGPAADEVRWLAVRAGALRAESLPPDRARAEWWWPALDGAAVRHHAPRDRREEAAQAEDGTTPTSPSRDGLAARLGGAGPVQHLLVVCDRSFEKETFGKEDQQVFEALAAHAGVALERARSVSDLEALAAKLEVARDAALAASEAKSLFLTNVSHELRTPLATVLATAEILQDTDLDKVQSNLLERLLRSGGSLRELVEAILDFARMEADQVELAATPFDLPALVAEVADVHQPRAERAGNRFTYEVAPGVPRRVVGDRGRVLQVLHSLLDNAVKFTHEGQVGLVVRSATPAGEGVELVVHDTGIGIAPDDQDQIFGVFSQVDGSATRHYEGTGLGLAVCRRLTHLMGGTIAVDSVPGTGSTFTVRLPLLAAEPGSPEGSGPQDGAEARDVDPTALPLPR
ncbi:sensor histidine kinase [Nocardioides coralli]|uniref:sensor histidine kinase n=1 Tax=Nocardioides coralli TaxID=2872154 RepID=UPI001CA43EF1|nr:ATP-binding protein [Nocardioides coralli]QZY28430.1 hypothetical protein K6T13_13275 [Nocardioides coralli]